MKDYKKISHGQLPKEMEGTDPIPPTLLRDALKEINSVTKSWRCSYCPRRIYLLSVLDTCRNANDICCHWRILHVLVLTRTCTSTTCVSRGQFSYRHGLKPCHEIDLLWFHALLLSFAPFFVDYLFQSNCLVLKGIENLWFSWSLFLKLSITPGIGSRLNSMMLIPVL